VSVALMITWRNRRFVRYTLLYGTLCLYSKYVLAQLRMLTERHIYIYVCTTSSHVRVNVSNIAFMQDLRF